MRVFNDTGHINDDSLALHILNDLPAIQAERIQNHLPECSECRQRLQETSDFLALIRALAQTQAGRAGKNCTIGNIRVDLSHRLSFAR